MIRYGIVLIAALLFAVPASASAPGPAPQQIASAQNEAMLRAAIFDVLRQAGIVKGAVYAIPGGVYEITAVSVSFDSSGDPVVSVRSRKVQ